MTGRSGQPFRGHMTVRHRDGLLYELFQRVETLENILHGDILPDIKGCLDVLEIAAVSIGLEVNAEEARANVVPNSWIKISKIKESNKITMYQTRIQETIISG